MYKYNGNITDTFVYDTYGKLIDRTGTSFIIFGYNGRDGVINDKNGLIYMRARYYSPELRRFINADIIAGEITNTITLNRYVYANGNPVSNTDPFGLATITELSAAEADLDPTDDHEYFGSGGGGGSGSGTATISSFCGLGGVVGYDYSVVRGGSYYNFITKSGVAKYDANLNGHIYEGTNISFENIQQYYVQGVVSVVDDMATDLDTIRIKNKMSQVREKGIVGEKSAGINKNTERIDSITETADYRIPDVLNHEHTILGEVKNYNGKLSFTNQLEDFYLWSYREGYKMEIYTNAKLTKPLQTIVDSGGIKIIPIIK